MDGMHTAAFLVGLSAGLVLSTCGCGDVPPCSLPPPASCDETYSICSEDATRAPSWFSYIGRQLHCDKGYEQCKEVPMDGGVHD
jgi:hypothetical protein